MRLEKVLSPPVRVGMLPAIHSQSAPRKRRKEIVDGPAASWSSEFLMADRQTVGELFKMSRVEAVVALSALPTTIVAEGLLHHQESVIFDTVRNRYLVANFDDGNIVAIDSNGVQSIFASPGGQSLGSVIVRDTLYETTVGDLA